ncbi:transcriptional regulator [Staphylococcus nepalensis]|uniref:helix-turn-helix domain-containing protein n=1 Tax=Staphylococcus nepalensis TaxID=214473 RepID=UPI000D58AAC9|nr:helix-turn-helix transcriptional regulator [Staphylococcus nepalensis]AWI45195.1 transcriptional regulator [Staphylococcus nepalensis]
MTIGDNIKNFRKARNINQSEFAKKAEISQSYLSDLENNRKNISTKTLSTLAEKFGVSVVYLATGKKKYSDLTIDERKEEFKKLKNKIVETNSNKENNIKNNFFDLIQNDLSFLQVHYLDSAYNFLQNEEDDYILRISVILQMLNREKNSGDNAVYEDLKNEFDEFLKKYLAIK